VLAEKSVEERVKAEVTRLNRLLATVDKKKLLAAKRLVENVAFMSVVMADLQVDIAEKGCTSEYQNGANQWGMKKSPEAEYYATLMQRFLPAMKQLLDLFPDGAPARAGDELLDYIGR
jgi:hypothetical protein